MTKRIHLTALLPLALTALALSACGSEPDPAANNADSFAARINQNATPGATPAPEATATPKIAEPLPGAADQELGVDEPALRPEDHVPLHGAPQVAGDLLELLRDPGCEGLVLLHVPPGDLELHSNLHGVPRLR